MYWSNPGWLGWTVMTLAMLAFWTVLILGVSSLLGGRVWRQGNAVDPRLIRDERLARGGTDEDQHRQRTEMLGRRDTTHA